VKYQNITRYKYRLAEDERIKLPFSVPRLNFDHISIGGNELLIRKGYLWDGASGPTFDTPSTFIAALGHDALYELMRNARLPQSYKHLVDNWFKQALRDGGMNEFRVWIFFNGVRFFGRGSCKVQPSTKPPVTEV